MLKNDPLYSLALNPSINLLSPAGNKNKIDEIYNSEGGYLMTMQVIAAHQTGVNEDDQFPKSRRSSINESIELDDDT